MNKIMAFINNTSKEFIDMLIELGYNLNRQEYDITDEQYTVIYNGSIYLFNDILNDEFILQEGVNCINNKELFWAIANLNEENDKYQWFINKIDNTWNYCNVVDKKDENFTNDYKKATIEELIEHFSKSYHLKKITNISNLKYNDKIIQVNTDGNIINLTYIGKHPNNENYSIFINSITKDTEKIFYNEDIKHDNWYIDDNSKEFDIAITELIIKKINDKKDFYQKRLNRLLLK